MRVTRKQLRRLIKEELALLNEEQSEDDDQSVGALEYQSARRSGMGKCIPGPLNDRTYRNTYQYPLPARRVKYADAIQQAERDAREQFIKDHSQGMTQEQINTMSRNLRTRVAPFNPKVGRICVEVLVPTGALPGENAPFAKGESGSARF